MRRPFHLRRNDLHLGREIFAHDPVREPAEWQPVVEPGVIRTDFGGRWFDLNDDESMTEYQGVGG